MHNSYQFFHAYHNQLVLTAIAVQEPDYTYTNFKTANKFTITQLYYFAKDYLGAEVIFWNIQKPQLTALLAFLNKLHPKSAID